MVMVVVVVVVVVLLLLPPVEDIDICRCTGICMKIVHIADSSIFYFVIMVRHGAHAIFTQMVSTHEAIVRSTLDFPNLISLNDVTQNFVVDIEIYGMVSELCLIQVLVLGSLLLCQFLMCTSLHPVFVCL